MRSILFLLAVAVSACSSVRPAATPVSEPASKVVTTKDAYSALIDSTATTDTGLFAVHQKDGKLYFEIPDSLLGREMLLVSRIAQTPADLSGFINGGTKVGEQVVRFEKRDERIMLRKMSYSSVAPDSLPVALSVAVNNFEPIVAAFDIEATTPDSLGHVIEVTSLFENDVPALSGLSPSQRTRFKVRRLDGSRSFIDEAKSFPINVNVRHTMTYDAGEPPSNAKTGTISMQMYQSLILLPEEPMMPRLADPRVGFFSVRQVDFGLDELKAGEREYIRRWRLEPSDPEAYLNGDLVEPVKPIVYYLDPATPERWRPYFCMGVEDWNRSFEFAGYKNAIQCEEAPENDPDFDPEDARYSMVRYVANTTRNATGPSVSDPRSGEIIESDIIWYHNHMRSYRNRLMVETGAANPQARSLDIDEELIGETMRQVIAHEIGHALGLPHNMIASSSFPVDSLRSPTFTSEYGVAPTIMDYARQNYIAQPGDGVTRFVRKVGPYDDYVINWGYRWYSEVSSPDQEIKMLDMLIDAHEGDPMYRFLTSYAYNPDAQTEDLGDNPVRASGYAVENLKRVVPNLIDWTSTPGEGYGDLAELYGELQSQWYRYMNHVVTVIGGVRVTPKTTEQAGPIYTVVAADEQRAALDFLHQQVFEAPTWMLDADILRRIEPAGALDRLRGRQVAILNNVLAPVRLQRMTEAVAIDETGYEAAAFLADLRAGLWRELAARRPEIDAFRRPLQRAYLERMEYLMTEEFSSSFAFFYGTTVDVSQSDIRALVRGELKALRTQVVRALSNSRQTVTRYHLDDALARIDHILDAED